MGVFSGHDLACIRSERIVFERLGFSLAPGGALILTGPNGSGKSSLLRIMAGIAPAADGELRWDGSPVRDDPEAFNSRMQYLGHRDAVKPALSVRENLAFHIALRGQGGGQDAAAGDIDTVIGDALDQVGLGPLADMPARLLSAGQTRRLALARIFACPATLWLLDEPTIALDRPSVAAIVDAVARHRAAGGMIVASTNVPLGIEGAAALDVSDFATTEDALWETTDDLSGKPAEITAGDSP